MWHGLSRYNPQLSHTFHFASIKTASNICLEVCWKGRPKTAECSGREREREVGAHKAGFLLPRTPLSPKEHIFNYRHDKKDMREFKCNKSFISPHRWGEEISLSPHSMLYRLARGRKLQNISRPQWNSVGACQLSVHASWGLMIFSHFALSIWRLRQVLLHRSWIFISPHKEIFKNAPIQTFSCMASKFNGKQKKNPF